MDVDKDFIERKTFSTSRRGYDQEEVDAHLQDISRRVEEARRELSSARLAGAAAEQVRTIVEAAERSAAEIEEKAELAGKRRTQEAERAANEARERADAAAATQIERVEEATGRMLERADALEAEVNQLLDQLRSHADSIVGTLRGGVDQIDGELAHIRSGLTEIHTARADAMAGEAPPTVPAGLAEEQAESEPGPPDAEESVVEGVENSFLDEPVPTAAAGDGNGVGEPEPLIDEEPEPEPAAEHEPAAEAEAEEPAPAQPTGRFARGGGGAEGARLVALNMALNGTPRAETARYLSENFDIEDQDALLDDVYEQVGGPA